MFMNGNKIKGFVDGQRQERRELLKGNSGVLLLEALLSVMILSVALVVIVQSMAMSARTLGQSLEYERAITLLENQLFMIIRDPQVKLADFAATSFDPPHQDFRYRYNLSSLDQSREDALQQLDLTVLWGPQDNPKRLPLVTWVLQDLEETDE